MQLRDHQRPVHGRIHSSGLLFGYAADRCTEPDWYVLPDGHLPDAWKLIHAARKGGDRFCVGREARYAFRQADDAANKAKDYSFESLHKIYFYDAWRWTIELNQPEPDSLLRHRLQEFENAVMEQLPELGTSSTFCCELDFVCCNSQQKLVDPIWQTLRDCNCFTVVASPCVEKAEHKGQTQGETKALRVPFRASDRIFPQAFSHLARVRHVQVEAGYRIIEECAWHNCQHLQIVHLDSAVLSLQTRVFSRCYALRRVLAPGCREFGAQVFEECVALLQVGINNDTVNQLAPQAELWPRAFHKCTALRHINLELSEHKPTRLMRCLPECCFLEAGLTELNLPPDFSWMGPAACERCLQLQLVDLSRTEIKEIMSCAFAHCKHLRTLKLPGKLRKIQQEAFVQEYDIAYASFCLLLIGLLCHERKIPACMGFARTWWVSICTNCNSHPRVLLHPK